MDKLFKILIVVIIILVAVLGIAVGFILQGFLLQNDNTTNLTNQTNSSVNNSTNNQTTESKSNYISRSQAIQAVKEQSNIYPGPNATYVTKLFTDVPAPYWEVIVYENGELIGDVYVDTITGQLAGPTS